MQVNVRKHSIFQRDGADLYCEVPIDFVDAALGKTWYSDPQYDTTHKLSGWGLGLGARWQALSARLICAQPITQSSSTSTATEEFRRETRWLFELRWH